MGNIDLTTIIVLAIIVAVCVWMVLSATPNDNNPAKDPSDKS